MLAQKRNLFSWTSPDGPSCGEQAVKMALVGTVFMAVVVGAAAKVTRSWLQEQGINKQPAEPIAMNIGTAAGRTIPVTLIPANDAAADVVNELQKKRQPRHLWSG